MHYTFCSIQQNELDILINFGLGTEGDQLIIDQRHSYPTQDKSNVHHYQRGIFSSIRGSIFKN